MDTSAVTTAELPRYKSHKEVWALKIKSIEYEHIPRFHGATCRGSVALGTACGTCERCKWEQETGGKLGLFITPEEEGYAPFKVSHEYAHKHKPEVGGYYVRYKDGYESFSPAEAFEDGNTLLTKETGFRKQLESAINRNSKENGSNTPDFILAEYLALCLDAFDNVVQQREKWYGRDPRAFNVPCGQSAPSPNL